MMLSLNEKGSFCEQNNAIWLGGQKNTLILLPTICLDLFAFRFAYFLIGLGEGFNFYVFVFDLTVLGLGLNNKFRGFPSNTTLLWLCFGYHSFDSSPAIIKTLPLCARFPPFHAYSQEPTCN